MSEKMYTLRISFGDGHPLDAVIAAKNVLDAQDQARAKYPSARNIYLLSRLPSHRKPLSTSMVQYALPLDEEEDQQLAQEDKVKTCVLMRESGHSHQTIAGYLGVGKSTVGRWLKKHG
jgi:DNA invertase Pin-like site-specific DNA recombinase